MASDERIYKAAAGGDSATNRECSAHKNRASGARRLDAGSNGTNVWRHSISLALIEMLAPVCIGQTTPLQYQWQKMQMPTAAEVQRTWKAPPPEYGPEPYYGLNGLVDREVLARDLDTAVQLGFPCGDSAAGAWQ